MDLKPDAYYKNIIARRDPRHDGRFYFGVKTTGIYCRPICPAKPKPENMIIFRSPSEAERAGYRACLRCHPDLAPGMKRPDENDRIVSQALKMIQAAPEEDLTIQTLAQTLGVTDRHLRRVFEQQLGASPVEIMITQRLHFAKQMIQETPASMTDIAFAVGFQSIRRFNEAFKECYHTSPSSFRKNKTGHAAGSLLLKVPIRLPYDWDSVLGYLKRHETYGVEVVENNQYRRYIAGRKKIGLITVSHPAKADYLSVAFRNIPLADVRRYLARIKNLFDTDHNPVHLPALDNQSKPGIRVPGHFDSFETAVSIVLSQLVSGVQAKQTLKKVVCHYGRRAGLEDGHEVFEFPSPQILSRISGKAIGIPRVRAGAIRALARDVWKGTLDFSGVKDLSEMKKRLLDIHGIGPWTATMISMRCLNDTDAFPEFDLVIHRILKNKQVNSDAWMSSRAYLTHSLWRDFGHKKENS